MSIACRSPVIESLYDIGLRENNPLKLYEGLFPEIRNVKPRYQLKSNSFDIENFKLGIIYDCQ